MKYLAGEHILNDTSKGRITAERNRSRKNPRSSRGSAAVPFNRGRPLGLPRNDRVQECGHRERRFRRIRNHRATLSGPGTYKKEEYRRVAILEAHWDLP